MRMHPLFHPLFVEYCTYFNGNEDYFECHEVLEEYWKEISPGDKHHPLVGYVQLATGLYHWRRGNTIGAKRILQKAQHIFTTQNTSTFFDYIEWAQLCTSVKEVLRKIDNDEAFQPFRLIISNDELEQLVYLKITELPTIDENYLCHKHMLRDRSDILEARAEKIKRSRH